MGEGKRANGDRFRLTSHVDAGRTVLQLEGWLSSAELPLLDAACSEARRRGDAIALELSGLRSLHGDAARRLVELARDGADLVGASGFVAALLQDAR
jgi:hypothetical protein